jgi:hypothetical protein
MVNSDPVSDNFISRRRKRVTRYWYFTVSGDNALHYQLIYLNDLKLRSAFSKICNVREKQTVRGGARRLVRLKQL